MKIMGDKEVGEQWKFWTKVLSEDKHLPIVYEHAGKFLALIRKLVGDRQTLWWHHLAKRPGGTNPIEALSHALNEFGIDPADWNGKA